MQVVAFDNINSDKSKTQWNGVEGTVSFDPDQTNCPPCDTIVATQVSQVLDTNTKQPRQETIPIYTDRNLVRVDQGWQVDFLPYVPARDKRKKHSTYYSDYSSGVDEKGVNHGTCSGYKLKHIKGTASIYDRPAGAAQNTSFRFETCFQCDDKDDNTYLGCITWGLDLSGTNVSYNDSNGSIFGATDSPSINFLNAVKKFHEVLDGK